MKKIDKKELKDLIVGGISEAELNNNYDYSHIKDMSNLFYYNKMVTIPKLNTQNVVYMNAMFLGCSSLTSIPPMNTENVISMVDMFSECKLLTSVPFLNTIKVTNMSSMFYGCTVFDGNLSDWDVSKVTNVWNMFGTRDLHPSIYLLDWTSLADDSFEFNQKYLDYETVRFGGKKMFNKEKDKVSSLGLLAHFL